MDDGVSPPGYQARLVRVEEQLAELQAEVEELRRIVGRSGCEQAGESRDGMCGDSVAASSLTPVSDGLVMCPADAEVRLAVLAAATPQVGPDPAQGSAPGDPASAGTGAHVSPVVFVDAPHELQVWACARPDPLREHAESVLEAMRERFSQSVAGWLVDSVWEPATAAWHVTDFAGFDSLSGFPGAVDDWGHQEIGTFVGQLGHFAGLPDLAVGGAGLIVRYVVPLPADQPLEDLSRIIQVTGIVAFTLAGGHVLVCAGLKSLAHDELADLVAKGLSAVISSGPDERVPVPGSAGGPESSDVRERGIAESKPLGSINLDSDPASSLFSFSDQERPTTVSTPTLDAVSGIYGEPADPGSCTSPTFHLPDDEYPDDAPEIRI